MSDCKAEEAGNKCQRSSNASKETAGSLSSDSKRTRETNLAIEWV